MKKLLIIIALAGCLITPAMAQETPSLRYHEFGVIFSSLNSFGLRYKYGNEKTMLRVSLLAMNLYSLNSSSERNSDSSELKQTGYGAGFRIGFDSKLPLFSSFSLLLGAEAGFDYQYTHYTQTLNGTKSNENVQTSISPGLSFIFGFNYILKDHLVLGAEINPTVSYDNRINKYKEPKEYTVKDNRINFSLSTAGAGLYIAYRFGK
ncbi:MAG: hypothetical protein NTW31_13935 [Bacteroidetes bacterium]|nr:hypothetical protein [Bacteroidota bacterium]